MRSVGTLDPGGGNLCRLPARACPLVQKSEKSRGYGDSWENAN